MTQRTTIEIDVDLLRRAKSALRCRTTRATVEEALRRAVSDIQAERDERAAAQRTYLAGLASKADTAVLASEDMWR